MSGIKHYYLHVDLDAFFASVEQLDNPQYRGKPLIVGGMPDDKRSVVSTASYEARKFGVHSAMPVRQAYQLCPQGIYVYPRMKRYSELSYQIMNIFKDFSPDVQQMSIDEAFIDLTGTEKLFGAPEETALKIKQRVKEETGLTVSVGLAPTKYLAKIASDMNKPDGFYHIKEGTEQEFMLNLPLKKVWGIGDKTLESLKSNGLRTTRDIYEKSLDVLVFMYGNNMGNFLYNVVRGIETITFDRKSKHHSISNETTFPYDISDTYTIETTLLELCHSIIFRLLKENGFSRTVMVKIRYEDFTTVSIQQTYSQSILTLDSLYNAARELFEKKYERGRGIRLIGTGLENIETTEKPFQPSLFEDDSEKKQNVEKAILKLKKKHPEINIHKARMLEKNTIKNTIKSIVFMLLLGLFFIVPHKAWSYEIEGYWNGELNGSVDMTFGMGNPFGISAAPPVFKQEVDISAFIDITPNFNFTLQFLDEFKNNTYALNYKGPAYLNQLKFSNRGITLPSLYSAKLNGYGVSGGNNEAPGIMLHFIDYKNNKWSADLMLRYEMTETKSVVFYGTNSVKDTTKELDDYLRSDSFVIPSSAINYINGIYVQSDNGKYKDSKGKTYIRLDTSDYLILPQKQLLILSQNARGKYKKNTVPQILLTFSSDSYAGLLLSDTGSYDDSSSYAGKIQQYFGSASQSIRLSDFSKLEQSSLIVQIEGKQGFIIQSPLSFSPYACANKYEFAGGSDCDFLINDRYSGNQSSAYSAEASDSVYSFTLDSFFEEKRLYAYAVNKAAYESLAANYSPLEPQYRYPMADRYPEVYLGLVSDSPYVITARRYTPVKQYDIGKKAAGGSVSVYRNGILEPDAVYDSNTGFVNLMTPADELDKIYITWSEESSGKTGGYFTTGLGFVYNFLPELYLDLSYTGLYPFTPGKKYSTPDYQHNSFSSLNAGINYNGAKFKVYDAVSAALQNDNTTKTMLASSFADSLNETYYLGTSNGSSAAQVPVLNFENPLYPELTATADCTVQNFMGVSDAYISGSKIPLSFDFSTTGQTQNLWAAVDIAIPNAQKMHSAGEFEMAFEVDSSICNQDVDVYLLLGTDSDTQQMPCAWLISSNLDNNVIYPLDLTKQAWQTVKIRLNDTQRSKLKNCNTARIVIVKTNYIPGTDKSSGTLFAGPYKPCIQPLFVKSDIQAISTTTIKDTSSASSKELFSSDSQAAAISWTLTSAQTDPQKRKITATGFFTPADFSSYQTINFDFALDQNADLYLTLTDSDETPALYCKINHEFLQSYVSSALVYHTISIDLETSEIAIDGTKVPSNFCELTYNAAVVPCRYSISIIPVNDGQTPYTGNLYTSSIYYKNNSPYFTSRNQAGIEFHNDYADLKAVSSQGISVKTSSGKIINDYINSSIKGGVKAAGILLSADADTSYSSSAVNMDFLKSAGHSLKSISPLWTVVSFEETYRYAQGLNSNEKKNLFGLDFTGLNVPINTSFQTISKASADSKNTTNTYALSSVFNAGKARFSFDNNLNLFGKTSSVVNNSYNYFTRWYDLSAQEFTNGSEYKTRNINFSSKFSAGLPVAELTPSITYELASLRKESSVNLVQTNDLISLSVPFTLKNNSFTAGIFHKASIEQNLAGAHFYTDIKDLFKTQKQFAHFYTTIPYYSLFDKRIKEKFRENINRYQLDSMMHSVQYDLTWKRKLFTDLKDLYIPSSASVNASRDITGTSAGLADIYQLRGALNWSFINLFGSNAAKPLFIWYRQDEYSSTLSASYRFASSSDNSSSKALVINAVDQLLFYINDLSSITLRSEANISSGLNDSTTDWKVKTSAAWERDSKKSLALELTKLILPAEYIPKLKSSVKDSASVSLSRTTNIITQVYEYSRSSRLQMQPNYSLNAGASILFGFEQNKTMKLSLVYNLGLKINF